LWVWGIGSAVNFLAELLDEDDRFDNPAARALMAFLAFYFANATTDLASWQPPCGSQTSAIIENSVRK
jgi:hypothetical protein